MNTVAQLAAEAVADLRRVTTGIGIEQWKGSAADLFRQDVAELPGSLGNVQTSYQQAAAALISFAAALDTAQSGARAQRRAAEQAETDRAAAQTRLNSASSQLRSLRSQRAQADLHLASVRTQQAVALDPVTRTSMNSTVATARSRSTRLAGDVQAAEGDVARFTNAVRDAERRLADAKAHAADIRDDLARAVSRAADALQAAEKAGHLPNFFDRARADIADGLNDLGASIKEGLQKYGPKALEVLDLAQSVLAVLALFPTPLSGAFATAALVCGATALVLSVAVNATDGDGYTAAEVLDAGSRTLGVISGGLAMKAARVAPASGQVAARGWTWGARITGDGADAFHIAEKGVENGPEGFAVAAGSYIVGKAGAEGAARLLRSGVAGANRNDTVSETLCEMSSRLRQGVASGPVSETELNAVRTTTSLFAQGQVGGRALDHDELVRGLTEGFEKANSVAEQVYGPALDDLAARWHGGSPDPAAPTDITIDLHPSSFRPSS